MLIRLLIEKTRPFLSLEFFPPREREAWGDFFRKVDSLRSLSPLFVSITCGAGGSPPVHTLEIASRLKDDYGLEAMPHLTCLGSTCGDLTASLEDMQSKGITNVLALRGDRPEDSADPACSGGDFTYAADLVSFIRQRFPAMGIGVAGYPGAHPESPSVVSDLRYVKEKMDRGADFLITQFFFDNRIYFEFVRRLREIGVHHPVIPGILPVLSLRSVKHILRLSGASIPGRLYIEWEEAHEKGGDEEVRRAGVRFAREQIRQLIEEGAPGVHLYTLNNASSSKEIAEGLF